MAAEAQRLVTGRNRRMLGAVTLAAVVAVAAVVGVTLLQTRGERTTLPGAITSPQPGKPPLELELGLRSDPEARALDRAQNLLDRKQNPQPARAAAIFRRYRSPEAQLGLIFATWSGPSSLAGVKGIAAAHPSDPVVLLNLGLADYQAGRNADAVAVWQKTASEFPDSPYGVDAEDALHPTEYPGLPYLVLAVQPPPAVRKLPAAQELAALKRAAARPDARAKLLYGAALWRLQHPLSAERELAAAAKLAPHDPVVLTAAAVTRFTKAAPVKAFSRLGPLTGVFPKSPVVRFHLGLLLLWTGDRQKAVPQLRLAAADGPHTIYAEYADAVLAQLAKDGP